LATNTQAKSAIEVEVIRKATWRLLPFLMLAYFIAFVDRVNAGFAALQMNHDIGLSQAAFGLGAGIFYISYVLCEVPSNLALQKVGARLWIARIMITWGMVSAMMALVVGPYSFYSVRFLLGAAEAGFFPGVILYLTYWFPAEYRGRIVALFMVAIPISSLIGSPISAALLQTDGWLGLRGWQWMFILEAIPAVVMGIACLVVLPNGPAQARWLSKDQVAWLTEKLASEQVLARTSPLCLSEIRSGRNDDAIRRGSAAGKWSRGVGPILLAASPWPATDASACRCSIAGRNAEPARQL